MRNFSLTALVVTAFVLSCGDDDDDGAEPDIGTPASTATLSEQQEDQRQLDEVVGRYVTQTFPGAPSYQGDCEAAPEATCSQFRGLDSEGQEYFLLGDPGSLESLAWLIMQRLPDGTWEVIAHDSARGWSRGDLAAVAPGECQDVRAEPGATGPSIECLSPSTPVTISGGPRYRSGLYFPIGEGRWILGTGLCSPEADEGCAAAS